MHLYLCTACQENRHANCDRSHPAPPGVYGGSKCSCPCDGDPSTGDFDLSNLARLLKLNFPISTLDPRLQPAEEIEDGPCPLCLAMTDHLAADPGLWPIRLSPPNANGCDYPHHVRCVMERVYPPPTPVITTGSGQ